MKSLKDQLSKTAKIFFNKHKEEISDIIVFGSLLRGKTQPQDIDIMLIFKKKVDKNVEFNLRYLLEKIDKRISISSVSLDNLKKASFVAREGYLFEGFSLINQDFIANQYGFSSFSLFLTTTKDMSNSERVKYYYALNGRRASEGIIKKLNFIRIANDAFIIPLDSIEKAKDFFEFWKLKYQYIPIIMPSRLGKKNILGKLR
ncbi:nucleotidyltransferase domain-containing protein [Candidatus Woesearchaeota archaeon]|nr:nucleotidyltransferase domain-containing protein [Candidatus Woesearchaeota archaeon]